METPRLILREFTWEDFDALGGVISDPVTMQHYPRPYDEAGVRRWIEWSLENYKKYGFGLWAMINRESGEFMGDCGLTMQPIGGKMLPEVGYHLDKRFWRRGYGSEAARAVRDWAFENTGFDAVFSYMTYGNKASWATARSCGMSRLMEYPDRDSGVLFVYRITREEWAAL